VAKTVLSFSAKISVIAAPIPEEPPTIK